MISLRQIYTVTDADRQRAAECAKRRLEDAKSVGAKDRFGKDSMLSHYYGALAEIGAAALLGLEWTCKSKVWAEPDVGRYEVRAVGPKAQPYVKTKSNDRNTPILVGVIAVNTKGAVASVWYPGWAYPSAVRDGGQRRDPGRRGAPAHFADIYSLNPIIPELM